MTTTNLDFPKAETNVILAAAQEDELTGVHRLVPEYSSEEQEEFEVTGRVETK